MGELSSYSTIGHDLRVYNMQIWLANKILPCWDTHTQMRLDVKSPVTGCITWCVGGCECFNQSRITSLPRTNNDLLQLTWLLIVVGVYKIYYSSIKFPFIREVYWSPESKQHSETGESSGQHVVTSDAQQVSSACWTSSADRLWNDSSCSIFPYSIQYRSEFLGRQYFLGINTSWYGWIPPLSLSKRGEGYLSW